MIVGIRIQCVRHNEDHLDIGCLNNMYGCNGHTKGELNQGE